MIALKELVAYLDDYLAIRETPDDSGAVNGLQVEGRLQIRKVAVAVDACIATIEGAIAQNADLLIVHHGLFWGAKAPITGAYYRRLALLIKNDLPLYSAHLPLDIHAEVGNNHVLTRKLGLTPLGTFMPYCGIKVGVTAQADMTRKDFLERVKAVLDAEPFVIPAGREQLRTVGICTGGAGSHIRDAVSAGVDLFLTGEGAHHTYFEAEENELNVVYAGHYATETVGVRALAEHLEQLFRVETVFISHPTGL